MGRKQPTIGPVVRVRRAPAWKQCPLPERLLECLKMAYYHDVLPESVFKRYRARLEKMAAAGRFAPSEK